MSVVDNRILVYGGYSKEKSGKNGELGIACSDMFYIAEDKFGNFDVVERTSRGRVGRATHILAASFSDRNSFVQYY